MRLSASCVCISNHFYKEARGQHALRQAINMLRGNRHHNLRVNLREVGVSVASATSAAIAGRTYSSSSRAAKEQVAAQAKADSNKRAEANRTDSSGSISRQNRQQKKKKQAKTTEGIPLRLCGGPRSSRPCSSCQRS